MIDLIIGIILLITRIQDALHHCSPYYLFDSVGLSRAQQSIKVLGSPADFAVHDTIGRGSHVALFWYNMPKTSKEKRTQFRDTRDTHDSGEKSTTSLFLWRRLIHKEMREVRHARLIFLRVQPLARAIL